MRVVTFTFFERVLFCLRYAFKLNIPKSRIADLLATEKRKIEYFCVILHFVLSHFFEDYSSPPIQPFYVSYIMSYMRLDFKRSLFSSFTILSVLLYFARAFQTGIFKDDFFFFNISHVHTIADFAKFFSPIRTYSYKPLASEVFYFFIRNNITIGRIVVFLTYFIGLYFLYQVVLNLTKKQLLAQLFVFLYAISFVHVFQLYWLATFQEVLVFAALASSFFFYQKEKYIPSIVLYTLALFSKETAILYLPFLYCMHFYFYKKRDLKSLIAYTVFSVIFYFLYKYSLSFVTSLDNYKMEFNPKRILNNSLWYFLWSVGAPNFLPDTMRSIFSKPTADFWKMFVAKNFAAYWYSYCTYLIGFCISAAVFFIAYSKKRFGLFKMLMGSLIGFFLFLGPILFFQHRWMVRLMIPLIFISLFQGYVLFQFIKAGGVFKYIAILLLFLYSAGNFFGTKVHESTSMYQLETQIVKNASLYFKSHKTQIEQVGAIQFVDNPSQDASCAAWGGCSKKLENTFHGQYFLDYYFASKKIKAVYGGTDKQNNVYQIKASQFIR